MPENSLGSPLHKLSFKDRAKIMKAKFLQARKIFVLTLMPALLLLGLGASKQIQGQTVEALAIILPVLTGCLSVILIFTLAWRWSTREALKLKLHIAVHDPSAKLIFETLLTEPQWEVAYTFLNEEADMRVVDLLEIAREVA